MLAAIRKRLTLRRRSRRGMAAVAHMVLALAVVFAVVKSGGRYYYCEALGLMPSDPCAEASRAARGAPDALAESCPDMQRTLSEHHADCCEVVTLSAMPRAAGAVGPSVAPAAWVATVPAPGLVDPTRSPELAIEPAFDRWRPPPRDASAACAKLMVFLI